ncbi:hypothetical protein TNCV_2176641 [Trichonephila clavipes]|uniref:Tc1-like transposase DDE domain-containing protein n=1 Tax=Trichonephila clavipes TaxID=2585209 RepID=A0A8X6VTW0_TRICX|nr:hypothetical protein TNCV_2176641 [Trichonephila clavipes]
MPHRRNKEKFQQFTEFERGRIIGIREGGFFYHAIAARVQRNRIPRAIFQQDNARPHVTKTAREFCSALHMQNLPWSAYSPDMSHIEHVWDLIRQRLARDLSPAASKEKLLVRIKAIWNSLPQADIQNLFDTMPRHIAALSAARGGYTQC